MVKNIYDKDNKQYRHEYFCDGCLKEIKYGEIFKIKIGMGNRDLCADCKRKGEK